jgi:hypothetical protein
MRISMLPKSRGSPSLGATVRGEATGICVPEHTIQHSAPADSPHPPRQTRKRQRESSIVKAIAT